MGRMGAYGPYNYTVWPYVDRMAIRHYTVLHTVAILRDILHCTVRHTALYCVTYGIILCAAVSISLLLASPGLAFSPFSYSVIVLSLNLRSCRQLQRHRGVAMDTCDGPLMEVYPLIKVSKKHSWKPHRALKTKKVMVSFECSDASAQSYLLQARLPRGSWTVTMCAHEARDGNQTRFAAV